MNKRDVNLLKRLVEIRLKMKELEKEINKDMKRYWQLAYDRTAMVQRHMEYGDDATEMKKFYDDTLKQYAEKREIKEKTLVDMEKLYEEI